MESQKNVSRLHISIKDISLTPPEISFSKPAWLRLNRFQTGICLFRSETHKWVMTSTATCECGARKRTAEHVVTFCPIYHHQNGARALSDDNKPGDLADGNMCRHLVNHLKRTKQHMPKSATNLSFFRRRDSLFRPCKENSNAQHRLFTNKPLPSIFRTITNTFFLEQ